MSLIEVFREDPGKRLSTPLPVYLASAGVLQRRPVELNCSNSMPAALARIWLRSQ